FRQAHHITGRLVRLAEERGCPLAALPLAALQTIEPALTAEVYQVLGVDDSVASRTSFGGTAPTNVIAAVTEARCRFIVSSCPEKI
ncbi:MAG: argininosuccinate lyase, partial [Rhodospirillaceae bacterium]